MIQLAFIALVATIGQTSQPAPVTRIHGVINQSQTWSGTVIITDDVFIEQGDVTVEPGTVIEFAKAQPPGPILKVGSDRPNGGRLILKQGDPITLRTQSKTAPGKIRVQLSPRSTRARRPDGTIDPIETRTPDSLILDRVNFEGLGNPAVTIDAGGNEAKVRECRFSRCGRLSILIEEKARITVESCAFADSGERVAIEVTAARPIVDSIVFIQRNSLDAALLLSRTSGMVTDNTVIGVNACISVGENVFDNVTVRANYIHNTSSFDEGKYCLNCEAPNTLVSGNFFRGTAFVAYRGSKRMIANVFVGNEKPSGMGAQAGRTQYLVGQLPPGAMFERNILIGPAFSMITPQPSRVAGSAKIDEAKTIMRNNTFDGARRSSRAIHLGEVGRGPATFEIYQNVFFRVECMLFDERASDTRVAVCDFNASAPEPPKRYERATVGGKKDDDPAWGKSDVTCGTIGQIGLPNLRDPIPDFDGDIRSQKLTIEQVLQQIGSYYRPAADSPLARRGRPVPDSKIHRETIGACDPSAPVSQPTKP